MKDKETYLEELDESAKNIRGWEAAYAFTWKEAALKRMEYDESDGGRNDEWFAWIAAKEKEMAAQVALHFAQNRAEDLRVMVKALTD